jgi:hypothetical protein
MAACCYGSRLKSTFGQKKCAVGAHVLRDVAKGHHLLLSNGGLPMLALNDPQDCDSRSARSNDNIDAVLGSCAIHRNLDLRIKPHAAK